MYRVWMKHPSCSPELLTLLWDDYLEKKKKVADKVKHNIVTHKTKIIIKNASKATTNPRAFWSMLSKFNKTSNYPLRIQDPAHPGIIMDDPIMIRKTLTSYWSSLGKADNYNKDTKHQVTLLETKAPLPQSLHSITLNNELIKIAVSKLKNGKATGKDNIPGEFLKNGGQLLQNALLDIFYKIKVQEKIPEEWYEGIVKPLFKDGSRECLNNYRGITISSIVYKVLVLIMEKQVMEYIETNDLLGEYQGAFSKGRRCEDHVFSLKGICSIRKTQNQKTCLAFLDVS
jgi:hypothetical protein